MNPAATVRRPRVIGLSVALTWLAAGGLLAGCAAPRLQIEPQVSASGRNAYLLRGSDLPRLQTEVARLCPQGADVLRQVQVQQRNESEPGWVQRWTRERLDPPHSQAQMQVVCKA